MAAPTLQSLIASGKLQTLSVDSPPAATGLGWAWPDLRGRVLELVGKDASAVLSVAVRLVHAAQCSGEPTVWVGGGGASFFPPDAAVCGVDLENLAVVRLDSSAALLRAVDQLLRSGAFGLAVVDGGDAAAAATVPLGAQARLVGLAKQHGAAVAWLSREQGARRGLGSFASLRAECRRRRIDDGVFECTIEVVKDKRRGGGPWRAVFECDGAPGLR